MALTKSIYNLNSYSNAVDTKAKGQYGITFKCNPQGGTKDIDKPLTIDGILNSAISWGVTADWGKNELLQGILGAVATSNPIFSALNAATTVTNDFSGDSYTNTGLFTRKYYNNSGDLTITPSFRVFDFYNTGSPIIAGLLFTSLCLPKRREGKGNSYEFDQDTAEVIKKNSLVIKGAASKAASSMGQDSTPVGGAVQDYIHNSSDSFNRGVDNIVGSKINWSVAPSTVDVTIGTWLTIINMVLTKVDVKYSLEMTNAGPLYADFDLSLVTRENLTFNEQGTIDQLQLSIGQTGEAATTSSGRVSYGVVGGEK